MPRTTTAVKKAATLMGVGPHQRFGGGGHGGRLQAVQEWRAIRRLDRPGAPAAFQRRQEQPRGHYQTRRHLPAQPVDPGCEVRGDECAQAQRPDLAVGGRTARACRLAKGHRGAGQQERAHPVGSDDQRRSLRCAPCQRQTRRTGTRSGQRPSAQRSITQQATAKKTQSDRSDRQRASSTNPT